MRSLRRLAGFSPAEIQVMEWIQFPCVALQDQRLCILNWNIAKQNHRASWQQELGQAIHQYRPDLFFFQEARLPWPVPAPLFIPDPNGELTSELSWYFTPNLIHHLQHYASADAAPVC